MHIVTTAAVSGSAYTGKVYYRVPGSSTFTELTLPSGVRGLNVRPCFVRYNRRTYIVGQFSRNLVYTEYGGLHISGIMAPTTAPTLAASGTGITGDAIGYLSAAQIVNGKVIGESSLGGASSTLTLTNQGRQWTIPGFHVDARATHLIGYLSMDGSIAKRAWMREIATTTVTENMPTTVLANQTAAPVKLDSTNTTTLDPDARGVIEYATVMVIWKDRAWYLVPNYPGVFKSKLYEPEASNVTLTSDGWPTDFIPTPDGEHPTGLGVLDDELVVFYATGAYVVLATSSTTFGIRKASRDFGCISHHSIVNVHDALWFASQQGVSGYFGGGRFRNLMARSYRDSWVAAYEANRAAYQDACAIQDRKRGNYILQITLASAPKTLRYVGYYRPVVEEGALEPFWMLDYETRDEKSMGIFTSIGEMEGDLVYGGADGHIREEDAADDDDDTDTTSGAGLYQGSKTVRIVHKHQFFSDQGGDDTHGRTYEFFDWFGKNPNDDVTAKLWCGDDDALSAAAAQWSSTISAVSTSTAVAKTSHRLKVIGASGKGASPEIGATSPVGLEHRGFALEWREGPQTRPNK